MNISQLEYFVRLSELKSLSLTAMYYDLPYQNISRQLDKLEDELGAKLLYRSNRGCSLTEAGEKVLSFAVKALNNYELLKQDIHQKNGIRLGVDKPYIHPNLITFISDNPHLELFPVSVGISNFKDELEKNRIDCFLGYENIYPKTINYAPISTDRLIVGLSPKHELSFKQKFLFSDFNNHTVFFGKFLWERRNTVISSIHQKSPSCNLLLDYTFDQIVSKIFSGDALVVLPLAYINILTAEVVYRPLEEEYLNWGLYYNHFNEQMDEIISSLSLQVNPYCKFIQSL